MRLLLEGRPKLEEIRYSALAFKEVFIIQIYSMDGPQYSRIRLFILLYDPEEIFNKDKHYKVKIFNINLEKKTEMEFRP